MSKIYSFSFYFEQDKDLDDFTAILDCRELDDPEGLDVGPDGLDESVQAYVCDNEDAETLFKAADMLTRRGFNVAFGCHAGKNRSVAMAERYNERCGYVHEVVHLSLDQWR
jgi:RNase adaptor protein for sRNA GlmZ degradation